MNNILKKTSIFALIVFLFFSCNEGSSISIMQALSSSQERDGKIYKSAEIIKNSADNNKVDAVAILANDGLYIVDSNTDQSDTKYLTTPTIKNNKVVSGSKIGLIRNVYIPSNYDSDNFAHIIIQCVSSQLYSSPKFFDLDLKNTGEISELTLGDVGVFCAKSRAYGSEYVMLKNKNNGEITYSIGKYKIDGSNLAFDSKKEVTSTVKISDFYESSSLFEYAIFTSTVGDDIKEQIYYKYNFGTQEFEELKSLKNLAIKNFKVYSDGEFMAFTQLGNVIHSKSKKTYMYTSDSSFSYNRYVPITVFENDTKSSEDEPDVVFFGKYSGNGFIIQGFNRQIASDRIYNNNYSGSVQTQGYAENLRSEEVSDLDAVVLGSNIEFRYRVLVLTTESGISTFTFDSIMPNEMTYNSKCEERRNKVDLFESQNP